MGEIAKLLGAILIGIIVAFALQLSGLVTLPQYMSAITLRRGAYVPVTLKENLYMVDTRSGELFVFDAAQGKDAWTRKARLPK